MTKIKPIEFRCPWCGDETIENTEILSEGGDNDAQVERHTCGLCHKKWYAVFARVLTYAGKKRGDD